MACRFAISFGYRLLHSSSKQLGSTSRATGLRAIQRPTSLYLRQSRGWSWGVRGCFRHWRGTGRPGYGSLSRSYRYVMRTVERSELRMAACDGETKSEIVIPLRIPLSGPPIGVIDLDSTVLRTFDDNDLAGLKRVVDILGECCDWT